MKCQLEGPEDLQPFTCVLGAFHGSVEIDVSAESISQG